MRVTIRCECILREYIFWMEYKRLPYEVEFTDESEIWWNSLSPDEQESMDFSVQLLEEQGIHLKRPHADAVHSSEFVNMRELRSQHEGRPTVCCMPSTRGGRRCSFSEATRPAGPPDWYQEFVPKADTIHAQHLKEISSEH